MLIGGHKVEVAHAFNCLFEHKQKQELIYVFYEDLEEIESNGETFTAKAMDIGSAIKSRKIDLLVSSETEAFQWGVRDVRLRVVEDGKDS